MAVIHDKFIFIHIPKTGGSSLKRMFNRDYPGELRVYDEKHMPLREYKIEDRIGKLTFTIVRNPYARTWSWYNHYLRHRVPTGMPLVSFQKYVLDRCERSDFYQQYYLTDNIDVIYQTEEFDSMIADIESRLNLKFTKIVKEGQQHKFDRDYRKFYNNELIDIINNGEPIVLSKFRYIF